MHMIFLLTILTALTIHRFIAAVIQRMKKCNRLQIVNLHATEMLSEQQRGEVNMESNPITFCNAIK